MNLTEAKSMEKDIQSVFLHTQVRINWALQHSAPFYDEALKFWVRCLYRRAVDKYHPRQAARFRGYSKPLSTN